MWRNDLGMADMRTKKERHAVVESRSYERKTQAKKDAVIVGPQVPHDESNSDDSDGADCIADDDGTCHLGLCTLRLARAQRRWPTRWSGAVDDLRLALSARLVC